MLIRVATANDCESIARIYNHYVSKTTATFEEQPIAATTMADRLAETAAASLPWLVGLQDHRVVGYALANRWKVRCAYRHTVECSIYLDPEVTRRGLGCQLYEALFALLRENNIHVAIGGISLPNPASVALHEKLGMEKVAHFKEIGFKFGQWIDVGYWQRFL
jgi:L-amino acid N-acyltransferase YncA